MRFLAIAVLCAAWTSAASQSFAPGYVVIDGDTLRGEIALSTEVENARGVSFRAGPERAAVAYTPASASAFGADQGRHYRRGSFPLSPEWGNGPTVLPRRVGFGRVVREGAATLLSFEASSSAPVYFVQRGDEPMIGLYADARSGPRAGGSTPGFRQILSAVLASCAAVSPTALSYAEADLAQAVDAYNACVDSNYAPPEAPALAKRVPLRVSFEVGAGISNSTFERRHPITVFEYEDPGSTALQLRAALIVIPPSLGGRFRPYLDLEVTPELYKLVRSTGFGTEYTSAGTVLGGIGVRYQLPIGPVQIHLGSALQTGTLIHRPLAFSSSADLAPDVLKYTSFGEGVGGQYFEVGMQLTSLPAAITARVQSTGHSMGSSFIPLLPGGVAYRTQGASVNAIVRI